MPLIIFLSLGWGVQSWTIAAMVALGELPSINMAIHADTGHEASETYAFAARWTPWLGERGVNVVTVRNPETELLKTNAQGSKSKYSIAPPAYTLQLATGEQGQVKRECTDNWKIRPIRRHLRTLLPKRPPAGAVDCWQGISLDEWQRMRTSDAKYINNVYPLVDLRMSRGDCVAWLEKHELEVPPKSACVFCPFHSPTTWKKMKQTGGPDWDYAVAADEAIRDVRLAEGYQAFVHRGLKPLTEAVLIPEDFGAKQMELNMETEMPCDGGVCFV